MFHLIAHRSPSSLIRSSRKLNTSISGSRSGGVETTRLPNGLTVASSAADMGHFATLGVYVNTGTRFETNDTLGLSYLMDRMAFKVTQGWRSSGVVGRGGKQESCQSFVACFSLIVHRHHSFPFRPHFSSLRGNSLQTN